MTLVHIIAATGTISLLSLLGAFFLSRSDAFLKKITFWLIGLSTGTLLGGAFLHLIPESLEVLSSELVFPLVLISFSLFFLLEKLLHWHHCHDGDCDVHTMGYVNLTGDAIHNFIDGIIIAAAFSLDFKLGLVTTFALAVHEIPQEIGDFGVLIYSGFEKGKALFYNFLVALTSILGGILGYFFLSSFSAALPYLLPIAAGGFLYISTSDLIPELRNEPDISKVLKAFVLFALGLVLMYSLTMLE